MAYKRRFYKRRFPKRTYKKKVQAKKRFIRKVKSAMNKLSEHKWLDSINCPGGTTVGRILNFDAIGLPVTPVQNLYTQVFNPLNAGPQQGTGPQDCIGDRYRNVRLQLRGTVIPTAGTGACRIIIGQVVDAQYVGAMTLTYGDVLSGLSGLGTDYTPISAMYNHNPLVKWKLLADEVYTWDANNATAPRLFNLDTRKFAVYNMNYEGGFTSTGQFFYMLLSANGLAMTIEDVFLRLTFVDY